MLVSIEDATFFGRQKVAFGLSFSALLLVLLQFTLLSNAGNAGEVNADPASSSPEVPARVDSATLLNRLDELFDGRGLQRGADCLARAKIREILHRRISEYAPGREANFVQVLIDCFSKGGCLEDFSDTHKLEVVNFLEKIVVFKGRARDHDELRSRLLRGLADSENLHGLSVEQKVGVLRFVANSPVEHRARLVKFILNVPVGDLTLLVAERFLKGYLQRKKFRSRHPVFRHPAESQTPSRVPDTHPNPGPSTACS